MATSQTKPMPQKQLATLLKRWDAARSELDDAGTAAAAAQNAIAALASDASEDLRKSAQDLLDVAQLRVTKAHDVIAQLPPLPANAGAALVTLHKAPGDHKKSTSAGDVGGRVGPGDLVTLTVIGPAKGKRRAGFHFDATPRTVQVTAEQKAMIEGDATLAATQGELPAIIGQAVAGARLTADDFEFPEGAATVPVKVLGPAKGRRRAGYQFGAEAQTVQVDYGQLLLVLGDDSLSVTPA